MTVDNQLTSAEMLVILAEAQAILDQATQFEEAKRERNRSGRLQAALEDCSAAAREAHQAASRRLEQSRQTIAEARALLLKALPAQVASPEADETRQGLEEQIANMEEEHERLRREVERKAQKLDTFNLTLFGRTMSGKSTLMEILTKGDGKCIGNGAQRTTRDVRSYEWQGLTVTDVPGVAAFDGDVDEQIAHDAATDADLVLFMITEDGPQASEAEHLARLRIMGRTVLVVCNVKSSINQGTVRRFLRDQHKIFDEKKLRCISRQFCKITEQYIPGNEMSIVNTHLLARHLSTLPDYQEWSDGLKQASRFSLVEEYILREVIENGPFHRKQSFSHSETASLLSGLEGMLSTAHLQQRLQARLTDRVREAQSWCDQFPRRADAQVDSLIGRTIGNLRREIPSFAEQYCEDKTLPDKWNNKVRAANIEREAKALQESLARECQEYFEELIQEIQEEIRILEMSFQRVSIEAGPIRDTRRMWNRGVGLASAGLGAVTAGLYLAGAELGWTPLGWALIGMAVVISIAGLMGRFFGSRDKKRREAIAEITTKLRESMDDIENQIRNRMRQRLDDLTAQYLNKVTASLNSLAQSNGQAAAVTRDIAWRSNDDLLALNKQTVGNALAHLGCADEIAKVGAVARVPGQAIAFIAKGASKPDSDTIVRLETLLNEAVHVFSSDFSETSIIRQLAYEPGRAGTVGIDRQTQTAYISNFPTDPKCKTGIRLAQQLTRLHIIAAE